MLVGVLVMATGLESDLVLTAMLEGGLALAGMPLFMLSLVFDSLMVGIFFWYFPK